MDPRAIRSGPTAILALSTAVFGATLVALLVLAACAGQRGESTRAETEPEASAPSTSSAQPTATPSQTRPEKAEPSARNVARDQPRAAESLRIAAPSLAFDDSGPHARIGSPAPSVGWNTERYDAASETGFVETGARPLSTFSVDVDTASYTNMRRFLQAGRRPPEGAVRIEELVNYFRYPEVAPEGAAPFGIEMEVFESPWSKTNRLVRIGISGRTMPEEEVPPRNLVFLVDVSGSMQGPDRLGLVKRGLSALVERMRPEDRVAIAVYAGGSGLVLPSTSGAERGRILEALERLGAGGSTAGAAGIRLAYRTAREHFDPAGINRVVLATDGDFNVGVTSRSELVELIEKERESGVFLTVLGFGRGNLNDAGLEELADRGNGHYAYVDSPAEARRVLVDQAGSTLITIAKDVKAQVEFNPARVRAYRLIGYENRRLADRDFDDDTKDAGEIGAGHSVTALYEIVPATEEAEPVGEGSLRYQRPRAWTGAAASGDWLTLELRYKAPAAAESERIERSLAGPAHPLSEASESARFSAAVALFGMLLQGSDLVGEGSLDLVQSLARGALGVDGQGERAEFVRLVALARQVSS